MRILFFIILIVIFNLRGFSQSITALQKQKQDAAKEIEYTNSLLKRVQNSERSSLSRLRLINSQINQRNTIISTGTREIKVYQEFIDTHSLVIKLLTSDVEEIKKEYAQLIRAAYRNRNLNDKMLFLFSAENVNQAYRRYLYMKRYTRYREDQAEIIESIQRVLQQQSVKLQQQNNIKQKLIDETQQEKEQLNLEKTRQDSEYKKLQSQQRSLRQKLKKQQRLEQKLEREIQQIIEEEARKNRAAGGYEYALTPEQELTGNNFAQNKTRLPWPVERGVVTEHFGVHRHPVLTNVQIKNNGINIATEVGAKVRAVFQGEVSRVFGISGGNTAVIIRHGNYLSVYSNLREVIVKKGDKVATKQYIGTVYFDPEEGNKSILKFQIWHESQKLDPEKWIGH